MRENDKLLDCDDVGGEGTKELFLEKRLIFHSL